MSTFGGGLLAGFLSQTNTLRQEAEKRRQDDVELGLKKEDLDLRRKVLQGQEASRSLTDLQHQLSIKQLLQQFQGQAEARQIRQGLPALETPPPGAPASAPAAPPQAPAVASAAGNPYVPLYQQYGQQYNVDPHLLQAIQEGMENKGGDPLALGPLTKSGERAHGLMQIMPSTATGFGVTDPQTLLEAPVNVETAAKLLAQLQERFPGDTTKVIGSYFAGPNGAPTATDVNGTTVPGYTSAVLKRYLALKGGARGQTPAGDGVTQALRTIPGGAPPTPDPAVAVHDFEVTRLQERKQRLEAQMTAYPNAAPYLQKDYDRLDASLTQARSQRKETVAEVRLAEPPVEKGFAEYYARKNQGARVQEAMKTAEGAAYVDLQRAAFVRQEAEENAAAEQLKANATKERAMEVARAGKAATPIPAPHMQAFQDNKGVYLAVQDVEEALQAYSQRAGTPLPASWLKAVQENAPEIQAVMQHDPAKLTGFLQGVLTKFSAATSNDPVLNRLVSALSSMNSLILHERIGGAQTAAELERLTGALAGSLPDPRQTFSLFAHNLARAKTHAQSVLVDTATTVLPLSGGPGLVRGLPLSLQIEIYERTIEDGPRRPGQASSSPTIQELTDAALKGAR